MDKKYLVVVALVAAVVAAGVAAVLGGGVETIIERGGGPLNLVKGEFPEGIRSGDVSEKWIGGRIAAQQDEDAWKNNTGRDVYINPADVIVVTTGSASSTFQITVFATTSSAVGATHDFTLINATSSSILQHEIGTSTAATSTSGLVITGSGQNRNGLVKVPADWYTIVFFQRVGGNNCISLGDGGTGTCEKATSTNRGITNIDWSFKYLDLLNPTERTK